MGWMTAPGLGHLTLSIAFAMQLSGCGLTTRDAEPEPGETGFPIGTYENCAQGTRSPTGPFLNSSGFVPGAALTLTESGTTVTASYVDMGGTTNTFDFELTSNTSATLNPEAQLDLGDSTTCAFGIGVSHETFLPAILDASAGALTYDSGTVFVSLSGLMHSEAAEGCAAESSPSTAWLVCQNGPSNERIATSPLISVPQLPVGKYACTSQVETFYESGSVKQYVTSGGSKGTLTLTQTGAQVTAQLADDSFITGSLQLDVTTGTTANAALHQSLVAPCEVPISIEGPAPSQGPEALPITSASLSIDDSMLFLSFTGVLDATSACSGAQKAGSVICSPE